MYLRKERTCRNITVMILSIPGVKSHFLAVCLIPVMTGLVVACGTEPASNSAGHLAAPDLILTNATAYTVDKQNPWVEALAISDGTIVAVGRSEDIAESAGEATRIIDLGNRLVLPAFGDAHVHPLFGGISNSYCALGEGETINDYRRIIQGCVDESPGYDTVYGVGWSDALFPPDGIPTKDLLDAITTDRPLIFESVGGHSLWVNSKALQVAGITAETPDPENGEINRGPDGELVGALQETAMSLVAPIMPETTDADIEQAILYTADLFNSLGITNWQDAGIDLDASGNSRMLNAYANVKDALTTHVTLAITWDNSRELEQIPQIIALSQRASELGFRADAVKFYLDGVIPQKTAAMIEPYEGSEGRGTLQIDPDILNAAVIELGEAGFEPYIHAIGDRGVRTALDAIEAVRDAGVDLKRPIVTHLNVVHPDDQRRFGALNAIAQFQPTWSSNYPYMDLTKEAIGPERSNHIYPAGRIHRSGGMIAYGADWPVDTADPLLGLQVATTRINHRLPESESLLPDEALGLEQAIRAHTINASIANGNDASTGSITVGKDADIVVIDDNIFEGSADEIGQASVILTLFGGRAVHGDLDQFDPPD